MAGQNSDTGQTSHASDFIQLVTDAVSAIGTLLEPLPMPSATDLLIGAAVLALACWMIFSTFWATLFHAVLNILDIKKGYSASRSLNRARSQISGYLYFAVRRARYPVVDIFMFMPGLISIVLALFDFAGTPLSRWIPAVEQLEPSGDIALWFAGLSFVIAIIPPLTLFFTYRRFEAQKVYQLKSALAEPTPNLPHLQSEYAGADYDIYPIRRSPDLKDQRPDDIIFWDHRTSAALRDGADLRYRFLQPPWRSRSAVMSTRRTLEAYVSLSHVKDIFDALRANINNAVRANRSFTNDKKIKLEGIEVTGNAVEAEISKTDYYTSEITNKTLSKYFIAPHLHGGNRIRHDFRLWMPFVREPATPGGPSPGKFRAPFELLPLSRARHLSNHIGGVHLALSRDGYPLLAYQSPHSHESANSIVTNGCGSMDWADTGAVAAGDLRSVLQRGHARELLEETGAVFQDSHRIIDHRLIADYAQTVSIAGYYRSLNWGGLPLFVGFSRHFLTYEEILGNYDRKHLWIKLIEVQKLDYRTHMTQDERVALLPIRSSEGFVRFFDRFARRLPAAIAAGTQEAPPTINTQLFLLRTLLANQRDVMACFDAVAGGQTDQAVTNRT